MRVELKLKPLLNQDLQRVRDEVNRVLGFRGQVKEVRSEQAHVYVNLEVAPAWKLDDQEKLAYLEEWIPAKLRHIKLLALREVK